MVFLRNSGQLDGGPVVYAGPVYLRVPQMSDYVEWAELRAASRDFLTPWEPTWPRDDLTKAAFRRRIRRYLKDLREDKAYPFFLFRAEDDRFVGGLTLSNIRRGVAQACSIGYWVGKPYSRHGFMTAAVKAVGPYVFDTLGLHRLEATCIPDNLASIRLLEKCGFQEEGFAREYLLINGAWRDHKLFALLSSDCAR
jgi:ribosomal-protein-alanine N-acetyltransferase